MAEPVVLKVRMSCSGCSGAVKRVLSKMEGVESFDIDMEQQKVTVRGTATPQAVLQTVSKTGKRAEFWNADAESKEEASPAAVSNAAPPAEITPMPSS